jgi:hypothetical protein
VAAVCVLQGRGGAGCSSDAAGSSGHQGEATAGSSSQQVRTAAAAAAAAAVVVLAKHARSWSFGGHVYCWGSAIAAVELASCMPGALQCDCCFGSAR